MPFSSECELHLNGKSFIYHQWIRTRRDHKYHLLFLWTFRFIFKIIDQISFSSYQCSDNLIPLGYASLLRIVYLLYFQDCIIGYFFIQLFRFVDEENEPRQSKPPTSQPPQKAPLDPWTKAMLCEQFASPIEAKNSEIWFSVLRFRLHKFLLWKASIWIFMNAFQCNAATFHTFPVAFDGKFWFQCVHALKWTNDLFDASTKP